MSALRPSHPVRVLLAGGGTGGHIFPNVAIAERLVALDPTVELHFLVSNRPSDAATMRTLPWKWSASPVSPLFPLRQPWRALPFLVHWWQAVRQAQSLLAREAIDVVITSGGFVAGPAMVAAAKRNLPRAMLNLDAVPGRANRRLVRENPQIFSVHACEELPGATAIGLPLRAASVAGELSPSAARQQLGLDPKLPTLFVTGATHGATSVVEMMQALVASTPGRELLRNWQVFHQCGSFDAQALARTYDEAGISAKVTPFVQAIGVAWRAADLAISRAGAGSVAEVWANAVPTLFLPNPYHADEHQRRNCAALVQLGAVVVEQDRIDPQANVQALLPTLRALLADPSKRQQMRDAMLATPPRDGAETIARWCLAQVPRER